MVIRHVLVTAGVEISASLPYNPTMGYHLKAAAKTTSLESERRLKEPQTHVALRQVSITGPQILQAGDGAVALTLRGALLVRRSPAKRLLNIVWIPKRRRTQSMKCGTMSYQASCVWRMIFRYANIILAILSFFLEPSVRGESEPFSRNDPALSFYLDAPAARALEAKGMAVPSVIELGQNKVHVLGVAGLEHVPQSAFKTWDFLAGRLCFLAGKDIEVWSDGIEQSDGWPKLFVAVFEDGLLCDLLVLADGEVIPLRYGNYATALSEIHKGMTMDEVYKQVGVICPWKYFLDQHRGWVLRFRLRGWRGETIHLGVIAATGTIDTIRRTEGHGLGR